MSADLLVLIIDVNPFTWAIQTSSSTTLTTSTSGTGSGASSSAAFSAMLAQALAFVNAFTMLNRGNRVAIIASHPNPNPLYSTMLHPSSSVPSLSARASETKAVATSSSASSGVNDDDNDSNDINDERIIGNLQRLMDTNIDIKERGSLLSGALSLGLCYINRVKRQYPTIAARILVLQASPDSPVQYVPVMNCIFSAQKSSIPVDSCVMASADSLLLQQASHLSGGIYYRMNTGGSSDAMGTGLLQYLLTIFLPAASLRKHLVLPTTGSVDYRATCFCHSNVVDIGYVCPVCLSVFCKPLTACSTCGTRFPLLTIAPPPAAAAAVNGVRPPAKAGAAPAKLQSLATPTAPTPPPQARPATSIK